MDGQAHGGSEGQSAAEPLSKKGRQGRWGAAVRLRPIYPADNNYHIEGHGQGGSEGQSAAEPLSKKGRRWCWGAAVRLRPNTAADTNKNQSGLYGRESMSPTLYIRKVNEEHKKFRNYQI